METKLADQTDMVGNENRRTWAMEALELIRVETGQEPSTPLIACDLPGLTSVGVRLKDESAHPTGSLKHRLARSLFVHGLCNGDIGPDTPVVEASSGSTAVSEAYFARIVGLPFIAVIPQATSREKIDLIEAYGGRCHTIADAARVVPEARRLAEDHGGHFMDQFTYAAPATDWRVDNIAEEIFSQMSGEAHPVPAWVVVGAGTGGTSTTIARYLRHRGLPSRLAVVDPEGSAFFDAWRLADTTITTSTPSRIEGIGRTRVEPSFFPRLIDTVFRVPDAASIAAMRWASRHLGQLVGASTGTNIWGTLQLAQRMQQRGTAGSIVSLICDAGGRYRSTYFNDDWLDASGIDIAPYEAALQEFETTGVLAAP